jgi:hypothetical protein
VTSGDVDGTERWGTTRMEMTNNNCSQIDVATQNEVRGQPIHHVRQDATACQAARKVEVAGRLAVGQKVQIPA